MPPDLRPVRAGSRLPGHRCPGRLTSPPGPGGPARRLPVVLREPAGLPEALPHQGLLVLQVLERAEAAPYCPQRDRAAPGRVLTGCHRDHHILVVPKGRSTRTPTRIAVRPTTPHWVRAVFLTAFPPDRLLRPA